MKGEKLKRAVIKEEFVALTGTGRINELLVEVENGN